MHYNVCPELCTVYVLLIVTLPKYEIWRDPVS